MNNTRRILFILLLILGVLGIGAVVYFLFLQKPLPTTPATQVQPTPEPLPSAGTNPTPSVADPAPQPVTPPAPDSPEEQERKAREALFRRARDLTSRIGTYGNADNYSALSDVYADMTPEAQTVLEAQRTDLRAAHPARGASYAQTTRALAARLTQDKDVLNATEAEVAVDVQQRTEDGASDSTVVRQAVLQLTKSGTIWKVSRIVWREAGL